MRVAVITPKIQDPERLFGAERHFVGMVEALKKRVETDWIQVPISEARWEGVLQGYIDCFDLDLSGYDLVVSTKTPTYMAQHPNHVCWLLHQIRVFYDRFDDEYAGLPQHALAEKLSQREVIHELDTLAFSKIRKIFTNGHETARRLKLYNGFSAEVLYPPVLAQGHYCGKQEYFLLPGRLHRWKRVDLAIRAMRYFPGNVPLVIAGSGEDEPELRRLAENDPRIQFLGFVGDAQLLDLYANALAVLFIPKDEDFGYITVEAMLSRKPLIVCKDSGEPALLVENGHSGFVLPPDPEEIAGALSLFAEDRELARQMGEFAYLSAPSPSWDDIASRLLNLDDDRTEEKKGLAKQIGLPPLVQTSAEPVRLLITDNQVLEPAVGGARVRVKELCLKLSTYFPTEYIGAYDWPGPPSTDALPRPNWHCRVFALSPLQYKVARRLQRLVPGGSVIDVAFPWMTRLSPDFVKALRETVARSEIVVFTHPWVYPLAKDLLSGKIVIYDAHNFEYALRSKLLSSTFVGRRLAESVKRVEGELVRRSDDVWVCSWEDADGIAHAYGVPRQSFHLVPNCADTETLRPADRVHKMHAKSSNGWEGRDVAVFVGSGYRPNTEAAAFIIEELAPAFPEIVFAIAGSVKEDYLRGKGDFPFLPPNVELLGVIEEERLYSVLQAADIALNPVEIGSGTNLKLVQYMAAGLAIISTETGVRGIERGLEVCAVATREQFRDVLRALQDDADLRTHLGELAREEAEKNYDWGVVLNRASRRINRLLRYRRRMNPPFFSVVIPSYNRKALLLRNLDALMQQSFPDFEVVVVDQSQPAIEIPEEYKRKLAIRYIYSEQRGPALARNKGIRAATGHVIAFTDDDCIPERDWLEKAARYFDEEPIAGLEGHVRSEKIGDPRYRTVSNLNFEGIGFMTANMFYRRDLLLEIGGFDERFPNAFREDTELAWRVMEFGEIPHARDAVVFHPPHPVNVERESPVERAKMFRVDPLLLQRHPDRYISLLVSERHYRQTPGFWRHFVSGLQDVDARPPVGRLLQQLKTHDPSWWAEVDGASRDGKAGLMPPEDVEAVRSLLSEGATLREGCLRA